MPRKLIYTRPLTETEHIGDILFELYLKAMCSIGRKYVLFFDDIAKNQNKAQPLVLPLYSCQTDFECKPGQTGLLSHLTTITVQQQALPASTAKKLQ